MSEVSRKRWLGVSASLVVLMASGWSGGQTRAAGVMMGPTDLVCEDLVRPMGVDTDAPRLSWRLVDARTGAKQTAYQIEVASSEAKLAGGKADVWDSGKVVSPQSVGVAYGGGTLKAETRYYWRVRVWGGDQKPYAKVAASWWETGVHDDWAGSRWIGYEDLERRTIRAARPGWISNETPKNYTGSGPTHHDYRLSFELAAMPVRATLYATGEDTTGAWINGKEAIAAVAQPKWGRTPWRTYAKANVIQALRTGRNSVAIDVLKYEGREHAQTPMSAELYLEMKDGSTRVISTDTPGWKATLNAGKGWFEAAYDDAGWKRAVPFATQADAFGFVEAVGNPLPTGPVVALRKELKVAKPLRSARLYATALGAYKFFIDGKAVGDQVLSPGWTDFRDHVSYQSYDVTAMLSGGNHAMGAYLAPGWYSTPLEWVGQGNNYGATAPALRAKLRLEYTDGSVETEGTDEGWRADDSAMEMAEIYDGESYNANLVQAGWNKTGFTGAWKPAAMIEPAKVRIEWQSYEPIRMTKTMAAVSVTPTRDGAYIYDFGQEIAGVARINLTGKKGTAVTLRFGEVLNPDGTLYTENLRNAKATDRYILSGVGREEYQPLFTFHGFRYVEVSGMSGAPALSALKAVVLHTDAEETVSLTTGSKLVNKLWSNILWGQRSNFVGVPTDCPQRDERLGWTADAQVFWRAASYNMDLSAFSRKYAEDLRGTQVGTSMYGIYAPGTTKPNAGYGSGWSDAGVVVPWTSWMQTGDTEIVVQNWDGMQRYIAGIEKVNPDHLWKEQSGTAFGDWLSPEGRTSQVLISTAYWAYDVSLMQQMAHAVGKTEDEKKYGILFAAIQRAFAQEFTREDGYVGLLQPKKASPKDDTLEETQTGYVLALHMNLIAPELRQKAADRLVAKLRSNGWKLATGFLGTPYLLEELTKSGYSDVAYKLLLNEAYPSWGYMVDHGATTMWERWNGDAMRGDPQMNSYNHYAYGAVADWIYRYAGGIDTEAMAPGFREVVLHPHFDARLGSLSLGYRSRYGQIMSSWQVKDRSANWTVTIPPNATGRLMLTDAEEKLYTIHGKPLGDDGLFERKMEEGKVVYTVPAGRFSFVVDLGQVDPSRGAASH